MSPRVPIQNLILATLLALVLAAGAVAQTGAPDLAVAKIDLSALQCGGCPGTVSVDIANLGGALGSAYTVWVELRVVGAGDVHNSKTYKQQFSGLAGGTTRRVDFNGVLIRTCYQAASNFEAKVYFTGGNLREGNTRNNQLRHSQPISARCAQAGGNAGSLPTTPNTPTTPKAPAAAPPSTNPPAGATPRPTTTRPLGAPDLGIVTIDPNKLSCGGCPGAVVVRLGNTGRDLARSYTVTVELRVTPAGDPHNAKSYKQQLRGFETGTQDIVFDGVVIGSCYQTASTFEATVYLTGGDYREGNLRNNRQSLSRPIASRCPR